jgi:hypothetical protein
MSIYVANLAAVFTTGANVLQPVSGIDSFVPQDLLLCSRNLSGQLSWLAQNYPALPQNGLVVPVAVDTLTTLAALLDGACAGAVSTSADVAYALGAAGDPDGTLCDLVPVGPVLGDNNFALPLTANATQLPPDAADALGRLVAYAVSSGNYSAQALAQFMPDESNRPQCAAEAAANDAAVAFAESGALGIEDVAGVFIVQAVGTVLSLACFFTKRLRKRAYAAACTAPPAEAPHADERAHMHIGHGPHEDDDVSEVLTELSEKLAEISAKAVRRRNARAEPAGQQEAVGMVGSDTHL